MKTKLSRISFPLFTSLVGFYFGNVFSTLCGLVDSFLPWNHLIAIGILLFNESIGFLFFRLRSSTTSFQQAKKQNLRSIFYREKIESKIFLFAIRCFQFSLLFGIFVDAFKVGS
jgi:hypothetical protein